MLQLTVTVDNNGHVNVNGPLNNKVIAYGLLELARDAIRDYHERNNAKVQPAEMSDLQALGRTC